MKIRILAFGYAADVIGQRSFDLEIRDGMDSDLLLEHLKLSHPGLTGVVNYSLAINEKYIDGNTSLHEGDQVAIIPPVSGG